MNGWMLYSRDTLSSQFKNNAFDWMKTSAEAHGLSVELVFKEDLILLTGPEGLTILENGVTKPLPDFVLMRSYALDAAWQLEAAGVPVYNQPSFLELSQNKWRTHQRLTAAGIPNPETMYFPSSEICWNTVVERLSTPVVVKGLRGSKGEEVFAVNSEEELAPIREQFGDDQLLFQAFVKGSAGRDIRVHVVDGEAIVAVERIAASGFKSNFHLGGTARAFALTPEIARLAERSAEVMDLGIAGVDILLGDQGAVVCEVNGIPGFRTVCGNSEVDIPLALFGYVKKMLDRK